MTPERAPTLTFLGAAGSVTGSRFLVDTPEQRVLVDCGLYQGAKELRQRNWSGLGVDPSSIDAVVLTHAHIDHCGYLPVVVRDGFSGPVYCSSDTAALLQIMLPDSGRLAQEEARSANRRGYSRHDPALPLFTEADARRALASIVAVPYGEERAQSGWSFRLGRAGHILGSAWVRIHIDGERNRSIVFTGDLGRPCHPLLLPPDSRPDVDVIVSESTYGDREHDTVDPAEQLGEVISRTISRKGSVIIPAFAVDRTDVVLFHLGRLAASGAIPEVPVWLDSPMASAALAVYRDAFVNGSADVRPELVGTDPLWVPGLKVVRSVDESKRLNDDDRPMIIISASGMLTGGRVIHHVAHRISDSRNTIALIGYQAAGTRGSRLVAGERTLKMLGRYWPVRAEVPLLTAMSTHADRSELVGWIRGSGARPDVVYAVHGEAESSAGLESAVTRELGWTAVAARLDERVRLDAG